MDEKRENSPDEKSLVIGRWVAIGLAIGAGLGVALENVAIGVGVGLALGAAIGAAQVQKTNGE